MTRKTFEETFGERGYSVYQLQWLFLNLNLDRNINHSTIHKRAKEEGMLVDVKELDLDVGGKNTKFLIAESNLERLMEICGIGSTLEEFNVQAEFKRNNIKKIVNVSPKEETRRYGVEYGRELTRRGYDIT
ncbi:hypothetical protein LCGC14_1011950 [marine sediment metagenome]|uniref:Uncharacterized protein n=1 Tax=marine sediment metagenome TaxID=412755 RepID=A0A0F9N4K3_9ZZZZ